MITGGASLYERIYIQEDGSQTKTASEQNI